MDFPTRRLLLLAAVLSLMPQGVIAGQPFKLSSGRSVEILLVGPIVFKAAPAGLALQYRTNQKSDNYYNLRSEADDIWDAYVNDVERGRYPSAVIMAEGPVQVAGLVTHNWTRNFAFEKRGSFWRTLEPDQIAHSGLNEAFVREFIARLDAAITNKHMNTLSLYMAEGWSLSESMESAGNTPPKVSNRTAFIAETYNILQNIQNFSHHRDIKSISIDKGGRLARVKSTEITKGVIGGRSVNVSQESLDTIILDDGSALWANAKSISHEVK